MPWIRVTRERYERNQKERVICLSLTFSLIFLFLLIGGIDMREIYLLLIGIFFFSICTLLGALEIISYRKYFSIENRIKRYGMTPEILDELSRKQPLQEVSNRCRHCGAFFANDEENPCHVCGMPRMIENKDRSTSQRDTGSSVDPPRERNPNQCWNCASTYKNADEKGCRFCGKPRMPDSEHRPIG